jgi:hypothetical protein
MEALVTLLASTLPVYAVLLQHSSTAERLDTALQLSWQRQVSM